MVGFSHVHHHNWIIVDSSWHHGLPILLLMENECARHSYYLARSNASVIRTVIKARSVYLLAVNGCHNNARLRKDWNNNFVIARSVYSIFIPHNNNKWPYFAFLNRELSSIYRRSRLHVIEDLKDWMSILDVHLIMMIWNPWSQ